MSKFARIRRENIKPHNERSNADLLLWAKSLPEDLRADCFFYPDLIALSQLYRKLKAVKRVKFVKDEKGNTALDYLLFYPPVRRSKRGYRPRGIGHPVSIPFQLVVGLDILANILSSDLKQLEQLVKYYAKHNLVVLMHLYFLLKEKVKDFDKNVSKHFNRLDRDQLGKLFDQNIYPITRYFRYMKGWSFNRHGNCLLLEELDLQPVVKFYFSVINGCEVKVPLGDGQQWSLLDNFLTRNLGDASFPKYALPSTGCSYFGKIIFILSKKPEYAADLDSELEEGENMRRLWKKYFLWEYSEAIFYSDLDIFRLPICNKRLKDLPIGERPNMSSIFKKLGILCGSDPSKSLIENLKANLPELKTRNQVFDFVSEELTSREKLLSLPLGEVLEQFREKIKPLKKKSEFSQALNSVIASAFALTSEELRLVTELLELERDISTKDVCEKLLIKPSKISQFEDLEQDLSPWKDDNEYFSPTLVKDKFGRYIDWDYVARPWYDYYRDRNRNRNWHILDEGFDISSYSEVSTGKDRVPFADPRQDNISNLETICTHGDLVVYLQQVAKMLGVDYSRDDSKDELCEKIMRMRDELTREWEEEELRKYFQCDEDEENYDECLEDGLTMVSITNPYHAFKFEDGNVLIEELINFWKTKGCVIISEDGNLEIDDNKNCKNPFTNKILKADRLAEVLSVIKTYLNRKKYFDERKVDFGLMTLLTLEEDKEPSLEELRLISKGIDLDLFDYLLSEKEVEALDQVFNLVELAGDGKKSLKRKAENEQELEELLAGKQKISSKRLNRSLSRLKNVIENVKSGLLGIYIAQLKDSWEMELTPKEMMERFNLKTMEPLIDPWTGEVAVHPNQVVRIGNKFVHWKSLKKELEKRLGWNYQALRKETIEERLKQLKNVERFHFLDWKESDLYKFNKKIYRMEAIAKLLGVKTKVVRKIRKDKKDDDTESDPDVPY